MGEPRFIVIRARPDKGKSTNRSQPSADDRASRFTRAAQLYHSLGENRGLSKDEMNAGRGRLRAPSTSAVAERLVGRRGVTGDGKPPRPVSGRGGLGSAVPRSPRVGAAV